MITEKDREELKELTGKIRKADQPVQWFDYGWNECAEIITEYVNKKRAESAEQARKESADKARQWVMDNFRDASGLCFYSLYDSILGDSVVRENMTTESEKLAIAVKALEEIAYREWVENAISPQWAASTAGNALKELQK